MGGFKQADSNGQIGQIEMGRLDRLKWAGLSRQIQMGRFKGADSNRQIGQIEMGGFKQADSNRQIQMGRFK